MTKTMKPNLDPNYQYQGIKEAEATKELEDKIDMLASCVGRLAIFLEKEIGLAESERIQQEVAVIKGVLP